MARKGIWVQIPVPAFIFNDNIFKSVQLIVIVWQLSGLRGDIDLLQDTVQEDVLVVL